MDNWHNVIANAFRVPLVYKEHTRIAVLARTLLEQEDFIDTESNENIATVVVVGMLKAASDDHDRWERVVAGLADDRELIGRLQDVEQTRSARTAEHDLLAERFLARIREHLREDSRDTGRLEH